MSKNIQHTDPLFEAFQKGLGDYEANVPEVDIDADWNFVKSNINPVQPPATNLSGLKNLSLKSIGLGAVAVATVATAIILIISQVEDKKDFPTVEENSKIEQVVDDQQTNTNNEEIVSNYTDEVNFENKKIEKNTLSGNDENFSSVDNNGNLVSSAATLIPGNDNPIIMQPADPLKSIISCKADLMNAGKVSFSDTFICLGDVLSVSCYQPESSTGIRVYIAFPGQNRQIINRELNHKFYQSGEYWVQIICVKQAEEVIRKQRIKVFELPQAEFSFDYSNGSTVKFNNRSINTTSSEWLFGDGIYSNETSPSHRYSNAGNYLVKLSVQSNEGCTNMQSKYVEVNPNFDKIEVPNIFTPNGDGKNDYYFVNIDNIDLFQLDIIDRNGASIFSTKNKNDKWDGRDTKTGKECPVGSYFYILTYKYIGQDVPEKKTGTINLNR